MIGKKQAPGSKCRVCCLETVGGGELHLALHRQPGCLGRLHYLPFLQVTLCPHPPQHDIVHVLSYSTTSQNHFFNFIDIFYVLIFFNIFLDSKYGSVRLGPEGSTPEYNDASWYFLNEQI